MKKYTNYKSNEPFNVIKGLVRTECNFRFIPEIATKYIEDAKRIADTTKVVATYKVSGIDYVSCMRAIAMMPSVEPTDYYSTFTVTTEVYRNPEDTHDYEVAKKAAIKKADSIAIRVLNHTVKIELTNLEKSIDELQKIKDSINYRLSK